MASSMLETVGWLETTQYRCAEAKNLLLQLVQLLAAVGEETDESAAAA